MNIFLFQTVSIFKSTYRHKILYTTYLLCLQFILLYFQIAITVVSIGTTFWAGQSRHCGSVFGWGKMFSFSPVCSYWPWVHSHMSVP